VNSSKVFLYLVQSSFHCLHPLHSYEHIHVCKPHQGKWEVNVGCNFDSILKITKSYTWRGWLKYSSREFTSYWWLPRPHTDTIVRFCPIGNDCVQRVYNAVYKRLCKILAHFRARKVEYSSLCTTVWTQSGGLPPAFMSNRLYIALEEAKIK